MRQWCDCGSDVINDDPAHHFCDVCFRDHYIKALLDELRIVSVEREFKLRPYAYTVMKDALAIYSLRGHR